MNIQKIICIAQNSIPIIVIGKEEIKCNLLFKMISDRPYLTLHKKTKMENKIKTGARRHKNSFMHVYHVANFM